MTEYELGRDYSHPFRPALRPSQPPEQLVAGLSRGKRLSHGVDHSAASSAEIKGRRKLYLYSPSRPECPLRGWTLL